MLSVLHCSKPLERGKLNTSDDAVFSMGPQIGLGFLQTGHFQATLDVSSNDSLFLKAARASRRLRSGRCLASARISGIENGARSVGGTYGQLAMPAACHYM